ncbi:MAG TPA: lipid-A-disaccharide synthase [Myxococcota bacterium]|nr:lipid-A-disaccharide synthase [Myxococcota bacterium]
MSTVLLSVGDASGDVYAGDFVRELARLRPGTHFLGMGGVELAKAGMEIIVDQREVAVGGLVELIPDLPRVVRAWRRMIGALRRVRPDLVVLVDSSGFNLPFARRARRQGVPTLYYVSPQVWGWRRGRIRTIARCVGRLAVIFPFEPAVYAGTGVPVEFVGHPLVERLAETARLDRASARRALRLPAEARIVALLPGSRRAEIRHVLPIQLETARALHARDPRIHFALPCAPSVSREALEKAVARAQLPALLGLQILDGDAQRVLRAADVALCKPGTSTLEAALLGCPLVVAARTNRVTAFLLRRLLRVEYLAMPNLIAGEPIVPELLQEAAEPERIADAVQVLLEGPARARQESQLARLRALLSRGGAARRAAEIAEEMIVGRLPA